MAMELEKALPLRVLYGWLPGVGLKEARAFVLGIADKHCEALNMTGYALQPFEGGVAYEVQEGGEGLSMLGCILKHFEGARSSSDTHSAAERVVVPTAGRYCQLELLGEGFVAVQLPESAIASASEWLQPGRTLAPVLPARRGALVFGAVLLVTGLFVGLAGLATRYQPFEAPTPQVLRHLSSSLPHAQWHKIALIQDEEVVEKLTFRDGKWDIARKGSSDAGAGVGAKEPIPLTAPATVEGGSR